MLSAWLSPISDRIELPSIKSYRLIQSYLSLLWHHMGSTTWKSLMSSIPHCDQDPGGSLGLNSCVWCILAPVWTATLPGFKSHLYGVSSALVCDHSCHISWSSQMLWRLDILIDWKRRKCLHCCVTMWGFCERASGLQFMVVTSHYGWRANIRLPACPSLSSDSSSWVLGFHSRSYHFSSQGRILLMYKLAVFCLHPWWQAVQGDWIWVLSISMFWHRKFQTAISTMPQWWGVLESVEKHPCVVCLHMEVCLIEACCLGSLK